MTPRTFARLAWLAGFAFVAGIIAFLPARLIEDPINKALAPSLHLATAGTVWCGSGTLSSAQPGALNVPLTWQFVPVALLRLRAAWQVTAKSSALDGTFTLGAGPQTIELRDAALAADVSAFARFNPAAAMFRPSGRAQIATSSLTLRYDNLLRAEGEARIGLSGFGLGSMSERPIGNIELSAQGRDTAIDFAIVKSSGALVLDGAGSITSTAPRQLTYNGGAAYAADAPEALKNALAALGRPGPDGRVRIERKVTW